MRNLLLGAPLLALTVACSPTQQEGNSAPLSWKALDSNTLNAKIVKALQDE